MNAAPNTLLNRGAPLGNTKQPSVQCYFDALESTSDTDSVLRGLYKKLDCLKNTVIPYA